MVEEIPGRKRKCVAGRPVLAPGPGSMIEHPALVKALAEAVVKVGICHGTVHCSCKLQN